MPSPKDETIIVSDEYDNEKRKLQLEEQLLDLQQKRLDLEQRRIELELKKIRLANKKPKRKSVRRGSMRQDSSDGEDRLVSSRHGKRRESKSGSSDGDCRIPLSPHQGRKAKRSGDEQEPQDENSSASAAEDAAKVHDLRSPVSAAQQASELGSTGVAETVKMQNLESPKVVSSKSPNQRSKQIPTTDINQELEESKSKTSSELRPSDWSLRSDMLKKAAKKGQSMRDLRMAPTLTPRRSSLGLLLETGRSSSMRDLSLDTRASSATKVTSNVSNTEQESKHVMSNISIHSTPNPRRTSSLDKLRSRLGRALSEPTQSPSKSHSKERDRIDPSDQKRSGNFVYKWADGRKYDGDWLEGQFHGHGIHTWPNGGKYVGEYKNGLKHGFGVYEWGDGSRYEGEFRNGKRHGRGLQITSAGTTYHGGMWNEDEAVK